MNEHNAVTPDLMSRLMKDLESPEANPKAAELFAKRKAMAHGESSRPKHNNSTHTDTTHQWVLVLTTLLLITFLSSFFFSPL